MGSWNIDKKKSEKGDKVVVPKTWVQSLLKSYHDDPQGGHQGVVKTLARLQEKYFWNSMKKDIVNHCKSCHLCAICKDYGKPVKTPLQPITSKNLTPFQKCGLDILGPLPTAQNGSRYIVVLQDYFTKWPVVEGMESVEASKLKKWLIDRVFCVYGIPQDLVTDRGTQLTSTEFEQFLQNNGIHHSLTAPFHPQSDGMVERFNRSLLNSLRCYAQENPDQWTDFLQPIVFAYRSAKHSSTGYSPFELLQIRQPRLGIDVRPASTFQGSESELIEKGQALMEQMRGNARQRLEDAAKKQACNYNKTNRVSETKLEPGNTVYWRRPPPAVRGSKKLQAIWQGPYMIDRQLGSKTFIIKGGDGSTSTVNADQLKLCNTTAETRNLRKRGRPILK